jgi:hypothetical protein
MSERTEADPWGLRLPEPTSSLYPSHLRQPPSWIAFMREIDAEWRRHMREEDDPERRLRDKNPERFRLD